MNQELGQPLAPEDVEKILTAEMSAGLEYVYGADNIAAERDRNYDYFRGIMADLPAPPGRSKVVEPTVANYIGLLKPQLLRIFTAGRTIADYISPKPELQEMVKLATRFINDVVFKKDNRGELLLYDWATDGLVQKLGIAMYYWEEVWESKDEIHQGIPEEALLIGVPKIEQAGDQIIEHEQAPDGSHSIKVRTKVNKSKCCIDIIPPEEFIISRNARTFEDAILRAHRTGVMVGDLIRQGFDAEKVEELPDYTMQDLYAAQKYGQLNPTDQRNRGASADPSLRKVAITRGILKCDYDGTGIKEWFFVAGGPQHAMTLLDIQQYNNQIGFADFCPEPMPHTVFGTCPADRLAGQQKIDTVLTRGMLDSLYLAITPQREVVMDLIVKPDQLMNMAPGAPVLVKAANAIREISIPFVGREVLAVKDYFSAQSEMTSGVGRMTAGLDPDALQNQSATASNNQMSAQQGRAEMYARVWAQGGMRKLFRGVFMCVKAHQDFARVVQIDGAPQSVDPRAWDGLEDLDVNINTGLGTGNRERDFAMLTNIALEQKEIIAAFGPQNPIVDLKKSVRTLQLKAEAAGISYPENFFGDPINPDGSLWVFQPPPPQPTPDMQLQAQALVQVEQVKAESAEKRDAAKLMLEREVKVAEIASAERIAYRDQDIKAAVATGELQVKHATVLVQAAKVDAENIRSDMMDGKKDAA